MAAEKLGVAMNETLTMAGIASVAHCPEEEFEPRQLVESLIDSREALRVGTLLTTCIDPNVCVFAVGKHTLIRALLENCFQLIYLATRPKEMSIDLTSDSAAQNELIFKIYSHQSSFEIAEGELYQIQNSLCAYLAKTLGATLQMHSRLTNEHVIEIRCPVKASSRTVHFAPRADFSKIRCVVVGRSPQRLRDISKQLLFRGATVDSVRIEAFLRGDFSYDAANTSAVVVDPIFLDTAFVQPLLEELARRFDFKGTALISTSVLPGAEKFLQSEVNILRPDVKPSQLYDAVASAVENKKNSAAITKHDFFVNAYEDLIREQITSCIDLILSASKQNDSAAVRELVLNLNELVYQISEDSVEQQILKLRVNKNGLRSSDQKRLHEIRELLKRRA